MDAYRLGFRLFFESTDFDLEELIPIFHRWIQDQELDELLIDVADYRHVPGGPGVLLVAHEAHYGVESDPLALTYARKRPQAVGSVRRLEVGFDKLLAAAAQLERALDGLSIPGDRWELRVYDRLLAPNDPKTFAAIEPELRSLLDQLYPGAELEIRHLNDPAECFAVRVTAAEAPGVTVLRQRLADDPYGQEVARARAIRPHLVPSELLLPPELREQLKDWVGRGYPRETCGLLVGRSDERGGEVRLVIEARNLDPGAGDRYRLDPRDYVAADNEARRNGLDIVGIWHSHPDCPARPSTSDLEAAWEGYSYLIVGITGEGEVDFHSWRLAGEQFREERIVPASGLPTPAVLSFDQPLKEERPS